MEKESVESLSTPSLFTQEVKWRCGSCGISNEGYLTICSACEGTRECSGKGSTAPKVLQKLVSAKSKSEWRCTMCFVPNDNSRVVCEACETPRADAAVVSASVVSTSPSDADAGPSVSFAAGLFKTSGPSFSTAASLFGLPSTTDCNGAAPVFGFPEVRAPPATDSTKCKSVSGAANGSYSTNVRDLLKSSTGEKNMFASFSETSVDKAVTEVVVFSPSRARSLSSPTRKFKSERSISPPSTGAVGDRPREESRKQGSDLRREPPPVGLLKRSRAMVDSSQPSQDSPKYTKRHRTSPPSSPLISTPQAQSPELELSQTSPSPVRSKGVVDAFFANFMESPRRIKSPLRTSMETGIIGTPLRVDSVLQPAPWQPPPAAPPRVRSSPSSSSFSNSDQKAEKAERPVTEGLAASVSQSDTLTAAPPSTVGDPQREYRFSFGASAEDQQASERRPSVDARGETMEPSTPDTQTPSFATPNFGSSGNTAVGEAEGGDVLPSRSAVVGTVPRTPSLKGDGGESTSADLGHQESKSLPAVAKKVVALDVDRAHEAAGIVYTWGSGECDQLAVADAHLNASLAAASPCCIVKLRKQNVVQLACGALHSIALLADGTVVAWGCNDDYALGRLNDNIPERQPARIVGLPQDDAVTAVACGDSHSACITKKGDCYIWGAYKDTMGYVGFPDYTDSTTLGSLPSKKTHVPTRVPGLSGSCVRLSAGENHTAVICLTEAAAKATLYMWGSGEFGQLAREPLPDMSNTKTSYLFPYSHTASSLNLPGTLTNVFCGRATTFLETRSSNGGPHYFGLGRNSCGELGVPLDSTVVFVPQEIVALRGQEVHTLSSCQFASIALTQDGKVLTWGKRDYLGRGTADVPKVDRVPGVVEAFSSAFVRAVGTGGDTMFAVTRDGRLYTWGEGQMFQIGDGKEYNDPVLQPVLLPVDAFNGSTVLEASGGSQHSVALTFNGQYLMDKEETALDPWLVALRRGTLGALLYERTGGETAKRPRGGKVDKRKRALPPAGTLERTKRARGAGAKKTENEAQLKDPVTSEASYGLTLDIAELKRETEPAEVSRLSPSRRRGHRKKVSATLPAKSLVATPAGIATADEQSPEKNDSASKQDGTPPLRVSTRTRQQAPATDAPSVTTGRRAPRKKTADHPTIPLTTDVKPEAHLDAEKRETRSTVSRRHEKKGGVKSKQVDEEAEEPVQRRRPVRAASKPLGQQHSSGTSKTNGTEQSGSQAEDELKQSKKEERSKGTPGRPRKTAVTKQDIVAPTRKQPARKARA